MFLVWTYFKNGGGKKTITVYGDEATRETKGYTGGSSESDCNN